MHSSPDDIVLHYQQGDRLLDPPARQKAAMVVLAAVAVLGVIVALLATGSLVHNTALWTAALALVILALLVYIRLRYANAGLFLSAGEVGVIGTLGERSRVPVSQVDHLQRCTLAPKQGRPYGVLLFLDRSGTVLLRFTVAQLLPAEGLTDLSRRSGIPIVGTWDDAYSPEEMARRFPGSVSKVTAVADQINSHRSRLRLITFAAVTAGGVLLFAFISARQR